MKPAEALVGGPVVEAERDDGARMRFHLEGENGGGEGAPAGEPTYTLSTDEVATADEGSWAVRATLTDAAGNSASLDVGDYVVDASAPRLIRATVQLEPDLDNALDIVTSARVGTEIQLDITVDEAIAQVSAGVDGVDVVPFFVESVDASGGRAFLTLIVDERLTEGSHAIVVVLSDDLGNTRRETIVDAFVVDVTPPELAASAAAGLVYERAPFGTTEPGISRLFRIRSEAPTIHAPGTVLEIVDDPDPGFASRLGVAVIDVDGAVAPTRLAGVDRPLIYVRVVDEAGNASEAAAVVPAVEWLVTPRALGAPDPFLSIHHALRVDEGTGFSPTIPSFARLAPSADVLRDSLSASDGLVDVLDADDQPSLRDWKMPRALEYDGVRPLPCVFVADGSARCAAATGIPAYQLDESPLSLVGIDEWDGPEGPRLLPVPTHDAAGDGGPTVGAFSQVVLGADGDALLVATSMRSLSDCDICTGGCDGCGEDPVVPGLPFALWRLDGGDWHRLSNVEPPGAQGTIPVLFARGGEVFLAARSRILKLQAATGAWDEVDDGASFLADRVGVGRDRLLGLRSIVQADGTFAVDVAGWAGAWASLGVVPQPPLSAPSSLFEDDRGPGVVFTGPFPAIARVADGTLEPAAADSEAALFNQFGAVVRSVGEDLDLLHGSQIWQRRAARWRLVADLRGTNAPEREPVDQVLWPQVPVNRTMQFPGTGAGSMIWPTFFFGGGWSSLNFPLATWAAHAYHGALNQSFLFDDASVLRRLNGNGALQIVVRALASAVPAGRTRASLGVDGASGHLVLFGGLGADGLVLGDTWTFDPGTSTWTEVLPDDPEADGSPGPRFGAVFVEEAGGALVLVGGHDGRRSRERWRFHATSWERLEDADAATWRDSLVGADGPQGEGIIPPHRFRGYLGTRPSLVLELDLGGADLDGRASPRTVSLEGVAGGDGDDEDTGPRPGVAWRLVSAAASVSLGASDAPAAAPRPLLGEAAAAAPDANGLVYVVVTTAGGNVLGRASLTVDSVAVRVRFEAAAAE